MHPYRGIVHTERRSDDISIEQHLIVVKHRSLNSELSLCFSGSPVQCCPAAAVCLLSVLSTHGTGRAVPTVSRGSTISTRPDILNTLTYKSAGTDNAPQGPAPLVPVTWNPARAWPEYTLRLRLHLHLWSQHIHRRHDRSEHSATASRAFRYLTLVMSSASKV